MNKLRVQFSDNEKAIYHIAIGSTIQDAIEYIEEQANKKVIAFNWIDINNKWITL